MTDKTTDTGQLVRQLGIMKTDQATSANPAAADEIVALRARVMELAALVPIAEANERERCAQTCDQLYKHQRCTIVAAEHYAECAAAIRALGA